MRPYPLLVGLLAAGPLAAQPALTTGTPVSGTVSAKDTARFTLRADSAFIVRLRVDQPSGDVVMRLVGPKNVAVGSVDFTDAGSEELHLVTRESGVHQVRENDA